VPSFSALFAVFGWHLY